jgi:hypothetical protein
MRTFTIVIVVSALFASTAAISVRQQRRWTEKLDAALVHTVEQGSADPVKTLIRVRHGAADRFISHLVKHALTPTRSTTPDLVAVQLPASMLRSVAADPDVVHVSADAVVLSARSSSAFPREFNR